MAKGFSSVSFSGNVGGNIYTSKTFNGNSVCSFQVAIENRNGVVTWIRINVYGTFADVCINKLQKGMYICCSGQLMNRPENSNIVEVRADNIVFVDKKINNKPMET
jgi:single-stranded DNA-binding protein